MEPRQSALSRPAWDVRQLAAHMLGMAEMAASITENLRQQRRITERYAARAPKATAGRRRTPAFVRSRTMPQAQEMNG